VCVRVSDVCTVDFVLVHEESIDTEQKKNELKRKEFEQHDKWRKKFMRNLQRIGVQCEEVILSEHL